MTKTPRSAPEAIVRAREQAGRWRSPSAVGHTQTALADINITPLVDVVLVLLVIFMISRAGAAVRH